MSKVMEWLLEEDPRNPGVRYFALRDLLDKAILRFNAWPTRAEETTVALQAVEELRDRLADIGEGLALAQRARLDAPAVGQHRDVEVIRHLAELEYLVTRQELGFVNQHAVKRRLGMTVTDELQQVRVAGERRGLGFDANARCHLADAEAVIELRREHQRVHAPLPVVVA